VRGLVALVAVVSVRGNVLMTGIGIGIESTGMTGREGEGVVPLLMRGGALPALTGGRPKSVLMTVRGPLPLLMM